MGIFLCPLKMGEYINPCGKEHFSTQIVKKTKPKEAG
jgi:hypothetical protein